MKRRILCFKSSSEQKLDRFSSFLTRMLNQISIWFSHELCLGVYANRIRWLGSLKNSARLACDFSTPPFSFCPRSSSIPHACATYSTRLSDWCVFRLSTMNTHPPNGSVFTVCSTCALKSCSVRVGPMLGAISQPHQTSRLAIRHSVPCRTYSNSRFCARPGPAGPSGVVEGALDQREQILIGGFSLGGGQPVRGVEPAATPEADGNAGEA